MPDFLDRLPKLPTPLQMGGWDRAAMEFGLPESLLMENAGGAIFRCLLEKFPDISSRSAAIFAGKGNNGGDGICIARHLVDCGAKVIVFHIAPLETSRGSSAWEVEMARADGVLFEQLPEDASYSMDFFVNCFRSRGFAVPDIIVDALLGTGFANRLKPGLQKLINCINEFKQLCRVFTLAVDIPSGLNGLTGIPAPVAIRADLTVTLAAAKPGLLASGAREWTGKLIAKGIGFPKAIAKECKFDFRLLDGRGLLGDKPVIQNSYKNIYGHLLVIGGAGGLSGASHMAASASLRAGAGLVTACAPAPACQAIKGDWPEIMTHAMSGNETWPDKPGESFLELASKSSAMIVGPGMGRGEDSAKFLQGLLEIADRPPTVFDADALAIFGSRKELLNYLTDKDILTPHPGEAGMMLGISSSVVQRDRNESINKLMEISRAAVVLKGAYTLLGQKKREILLCPYDIPQLAIGGAGDVLAGIAGAFLAASRTDENSLGIAARAVITHIIAGMIIAEKYPCRGARATDLADAVSQVQTWIADRPKNDLLEGLLPWPQFL